MAAEAEIALAEWWAKFWKVMQMAPEIAKTRKGSTGEICNRTGGDGCGSAWTHGTGGDGGGSAWTRGTGGNGGWDGRRLKGSASEICDRMGGNGGGSAWTRGMGGDGGWDGRRRWLGRAMMVAVPSINADGRRWEDDGWSAVWGSRTGTTRG